VAGRSAGAVSQPGAHEGQKTYCPVSGVVFQIRRDSPHRDVGGRPVYFCCESCARYFGQHRAKVLATRRLAAL